MFNNDKPFYGVGIEWHQKLENGLFKHFQEFGCFEFIPENFFYGQGVDFLEALNRSKIPVVVHGVELSFGTDEPIKQEHLDTILELSAKVNTVIFSEHLAMTEVDGIEIGQLTPLPWTIESADAVSRKIEAIQKQIDYPFMMENITNRFLIPDCELSETQFIRQILKQTGCGLLLDLNNVHTNATNFGFDPFEWLSEIPMESVMGIHLAGGYYDEEGILQDSHDNPVPEPVWGLYRYVCEQTLPPATIVERTGNIPTFGQLLDEVKKARLILEQTNPKLKAVQVKPSEPVHVHAV